MIEDWHSSVLCQAAKNKSSWLLASVIGWLVAMACLAATILKRADRAALGWWCSSALNFTTMAVSCYLWISFLVQAQAKGKGIYFTQERFLPLSMGRIEKDRM